MNFIKIYLAKYYFYFYELIYFIIEYILNFNLNQVFRLRIELLNLNL